mgnify:FL=1
MPEEKDVKEVEARVREIIQGPLNDFDKELAKALELPVEEQVIALWNTARALYERELILDRKSVV